MSRYDDVYVECPFFKRRRARGDIVCEGYIKGMEVAIQYEDASVTEYHSRRHCQNNFAQCPIYKMIMEELKDVYE